MQPTLQIMTPRRSLLGSAPRKRFGQITAFALGLLALCSGCQIIQQRKPLPARIVRVRGNARGGFDTKTWWPLKAGDVLLEGAVFQTARDSYIDVALGDLVVPVSSRQFPRPRVPIDTSGDINALRLKEDSGLRVEVLNLRKAKNGILADTRFQLKRGEIFITAKHLSPDSNCTFGLTNALVRITPGTVSEISFDGVVRVREGQVEVTQPGISVTKSVSSWEQFDVRTGVTTPIPSDVLN
jgi:hypothetical protein